ncbi:uncharacterized protein TRIADDRAFT_28404 [Trichoplax adhaerens]|uniref:Insulin-degrading enzyme n=1 Tax=Trichoplax adhaerens TaxID=10228 RepID=B3S2Y5_TRIAD|nr:hypothetical protein TRIADDRAFT_28404 [Trichoplax adhaerens]EDV22870.1 hypothetical protein TRIADDRAFT_28404 [Trichoplax adhaerens]|eukprot:XP_002114736.1 hypothetical protein TRIADDRAFT_28404 [Trichoplax adhaerens]
MEKVIDPRVLRASDNIIRSAEDKRLYRSLQLSNHIKVILVQDDKADKAAASLDVHIGHLMDPPELPGLAHFCEHMLFLGTEKYPLENGFSQFLSEHSGSSNAFTSAEHTNYYFEVATQYLQEALDRFSQFFIAPLFNADSKDREVKAINSENDNNKKSDLWRLSQLDKSTCKPSHPFSKFGTGNLYTLGTRALEKKIDVREELLKFHSQYYSANLMTLAIVSKESLDDLSKIAIECFSSIVDKNILKPEFNDHPYGADELQTKFCVVPIKDTPIIELLFPLPDMSEHYTSKPCHYIAHLVGHEGSGSLLSLLKSKGWINTLQAGAKHGAKGFMFFMISCKLTEEGFNHLNEIISYIFQYLTLLRNSGPQEWIFTECQNLGEMNFRFKDRERPQGYAVYLASSLQKYPLEEVLCAQFLMQSYSPDIIKEVLDHLRPESFRLFVISPKFEDIADKTEEWYGTRYKEEKIPLDLIQSWAEVGETDGLNLPRRNEFIPTDFDIKKSSDKPTQYPTIIKEDSLSKTWFKQDNSFFLPKACFCFDITSPFTYVDPAHFNMTRLFVTLVMDSLNEFAYDAEIAGISYILHATFYGIQLIIRGYNDKQKVLLSKILNEVAQFKIDPKRFLIIKNEYKRQLLNFKAEKPYMHAAYYVNYLLEDTFWTNDDLSDALDDISCEQVQAFIPLFLSRLYIEALLMGNLTQEEAIEISTLVCSVFRDCAGTKALLPSQRMKHRQIQLQDGCSYLFEVVNDVHPSSCIEVYYQYGLQSTTTNSLIELFCQVINEPCFDILRTKEQLGYIVFSGVRRAHGAQGLRVLVQSDHNPAFVESRIEAFMVSMKEHLELLTEENFRKHLNALIIRKSEKPKKLNEECHRYFSEIVSRQYNFDRDNIEINYLKTVNKTELLQFYMDLIEKDAPKRKKLSVRVVSRKVAGKSAYVHFSVCNIS